MDFQGPTHLMVISPTIHALALLYTLPGLGCFGMPTRRRHGYPAPDLDRLSEAGARARPGLRRPFRPIGPEQPPRLNLPATSDPRRLLVEFDPDSGQVTTQPMVGDVALAPATRVGMLAYAHEMTLLGFQRLLAGHVDLEPQQSGLQHAQRRGRIPGSRSRCPRRCRPRCRACSARAGRRSTCRAPRTSRSPAPATGPTSRSD